MAACTSNGDSPPQTLDPSMRVAAEVIAVTDGDSIDVATGDAAFTVRLAALNAPELGECFFDVTSAHLTETVLGATVSLELFGTDQFDRTLAHVFAGDRHINLEMVSSGLALASSPDEQDPYRDIMVSTEEEAFESRAGLWAADACGSADGLAEVSIDPDQSEPDPPGPDGARLHDEVMTVVNNGHESVDLTGWTLRDESSRHRFSFPGGTSMEPGEFLEVHSDAVGWDPGGTPVWNNEGDMALLLDPSGTVVSRWRY